MIDPKLAMLLFNTLGFGILGSLIGGSLRAWSIWRHNGSGPGIGESAAIGFLAGAAWGAFRAVFRSLIS